MAQLVECLVRKHKPLVQYPALREPGDCWNIGDWDIGELEVQREEPEVRESKTEEQRDRLLPSCSPRNLKLQLLGQDLHKTSTAELGWGHKLGLLTEEFLTAVWL